jgi:starch phosphorylase
MVQEYVEKCYWPSTQRNERLMADKLQNAANLAKWRQRLVAGWPQVRVEYVESNGADPLHVGSDMHVNARVNLGNLSPSDVEVQLFHGGVDSLGEIPKPEAVPMIADGKRDGNTWNYLGAFPCQASGQHGFAVRVLPKHADLANLFEPALVCWG